MLFAYSIYGVSMYFSDNQKSASMRRAGNRQWGLKPLDLAVLFMLVIIRREPKYTYAALAKLMMLSQFEVHASVQRLIAAKLIVNAGEYFRPVMEAIRHYVLFGASYCYPAIRGEATIGFATAYGVPPLSEKVLFSQEMPPVWPHPEGDQRKKDQTQRDGDERQEPRGGAICAAVALGCCRTPR